MRTLLTAATVLVCVLLVTTSAGAEDRVELRNGGVIRGHIVEETEEFVTVELAIGGRMKIRRSRIEAIVRGDASGLFRIAAPLMRAMVARSVRGDYRRLKSILEGS